MRFVVLAVLIWSTAFFVLPCLANSDPYYQTAQSELQRRLAVKPIETPAKNIILFVADGNGVRTNFAIRMYAGQREGKLGEEHMLPYEQLPYLALAKTYNTNAQTPDSAGTASALQTGVKTKAGVLAVDQNLVYGDCKNTAQHALPSIGDLLAKQGKSVGYVTTTRITHATPAAGYAKAARRDYEDDSRLPEGCDYPDIASQLITRMQSGDVDVALGGGRRHLLPVSQGGKRQDRRNLLTEAQQSGVKYVHNRDKLLALPPGNKPLLGLFSDSHLAYAFDRPLDQPTLAEMVQAALAQLEQNPNGYFLLVESGRIDHANHRGNLHRTVTDGLAFAEAVALAIAQTSEQDTLLIVTADHGHAMTFNGYCGRGTPITGLCFGIDPAGEKHTSKPQTADDGKTYTVAGFANGPGALWVNGTSGWRPKKRKALTQQQAQDPDHRQLALLPMGSETHSPEDVAVYARGPWAHLLDGTIEQHFVFHVMLHAAEFGGRE